MEQLPNLSGLSHEEKDAIIHLLFDTVLALRQEVAALRAENAELKAELEKLRGQLSKDSHNSSKPPSSDGLRKKTRSLRQPSERPAGGVKGHPGHRREQVANPDHVIDHPLPDFCETCQAAVEPEGYEARQVFELPETPIEVTEHRIWRGRCQCPCAKWAPYPSSLQSPVQYGPRFKALAVTLHHHHMVPVARTCEILESLCGLRPSRASVINWVSEAASRLEQTYERIGKTLLQKPVLGADESGLRAQGSAWLHVLAGDDLTWVGVHRKRGREAFEDFGLIPEYQGTLVHDGFSSYQRYTCTHALCNAHHLRQLKFEHEVNQQHWALEMSEFLLKALKETRQHPEGIHQERLTQLRKEYRQILQTAHQLNPRKPPDGYPGKTPQTSTVNLLARLDEREDEVLRFLSDPQVPFTNNDSEREVRMPKVKLKIIGTFRSFHGAQSFATIRACCSSIKKQNHSILQALETLFLGKELPLQLTA
jgi:transposase